MIKLYLKSNTENHLVYDYFVNDNKDDGNHGIVQVSKIDRSYEIIKKDNSPFGSSWAHAVRFALAEVDEGKAQQVGIVAWY